MSGSYGHADTCSSQPRSDEGSRRPRSVDGTTRVPVLPKLMRAALLSRTAFEIRLLNAYCILEGAVSNLRPIVHTLSEERLVA